MDAGPLTLDGAADELYAGPPEDFISRRKDLVTQARGQKDRPLATAIGQLRRPTRTAWLLNLLAHEHPEQIDQLLELGTALAEAQRNRAGAELRRLSAERRTVIETLTRSAVEAGAAHGHAATEATQAELAPTLTAALADPTVASDLRQGRLTQAASYGGFGPELILSPGGADGDPGVAAEEETTADPDADAAGARAQAATEEEPEEESGEQSAAAEAARTARAEAEELAEAAERAESDADQATEQADELADRVEQLRTQLAEAEEAAGQSAERARAARREYTKARDAAAAAEKAAAEAEQAASDAS